MSVELAEAVERLTEERNPLAGDETRTTVRTLLAALESGAVRAAEPTASGWQVNTWVKHGILLAFRSGIIEACDSAGPLAFADKDTLPVQGVPRGVRVVPGGSAVRAGAHLAPGVVVMPPAYVNVGAHVGAGTLIDSHALVGSCAQVGEGVHLSAAAQVGGVLEPVGELPVIIEDDVFIGGGCGLYEGVLVRRGAVLAAGVILTRSVQVHDCVHGRVLRADARGVLEIPEDAVVVMGSRPASGEHAASARLQIATPLIVKYRTASTDARAALEGALR